MATNVPDTSDVGVSRQDAADHLARCPSCVERLAKARRSHKAVGLRAWKAQLAAHMKDEQRQP